jgi:hypothetical protein
MQRIKLFSVIVLLAMLYACQGGFSWHHANDSASNQPNGKPTDPASANASKQADDNPFNQLMDTTKLKADVNNILNSIATGKPDTNALKTAGSDILSTTANVLSDSGIDKLYGNNNDPAVVEAKNILKKMRTATGLTPQSLDSMKQAAAKLMQGH